MRWLLLRGLVRESRHWLDFPDFFKANVRSSDGSTEVVLLDLPGFGTQNDAVVPNTIDGFVDDMRARLREQVPEGEKIGIVAVSLGGMVALNWLSRFPDDFVCGVVINSSVGDLSPVWQRMQPANWPTIFRAPFMKPLARERRILSRTRHLGDLDKDAQRYADIAQQTVPKPKNAVAQLRAAIAFSSPTKIDVPTMVLVSKGDALVSWRCSDAIAKRLSLPLHIHEGTGREAAGHDLPLDAPEWVCARINDFVTENAHA